MLSLVALVTATANKPELNQSDTTYCTNDVCDFTSLDVSAYTDFTYLFAESLWLDITTINIAGWNLESATTLTGTEGMFDKSTKVINITGTLIKNGRRMFDEFKGTLIGTPTLNSHADLTAMFYLSSATIDLRHWDFEVQMTLNQMFYDSNSTVIIYEDQHNILEKLTAEANDNPPQFVGTLDIRIRQMICTCDAANITLCVSCTDVTFVGNELHAMGYYDGAICANWESFTAVDFNGSLVDNAFRSCQKLNHVHFPEMTGDIGVEAFFYTQIKSINFPSMLGTIKGNAFRSCYELQTVHFPSMTGSIENNAFENCNKLERVYFSAMEGIIQSGAFWNCGSLSYADFGKTNKLDYKDSLGTNTPIFKGTPNFKKLCLRHVTTVDNGMLDDSSLTSVYMPKLHKERFNEVTASICTPSSKCDNTEAAACGGVSTPIVTTDDDDDDSALIIGLSAGGGVLVLAVAVTLYVKKCKRHPGYQALIF